jgi:hypothetical protein
MRAVKDSLAAPLGGEVRKKTRKGWDGLLRLLCSRNAHAQKVLARANGTSRRVSGWEGEKAARSGRPNRPPFREGEVGDNKKTGMGSGQVPFLIAERRKGWRLDLLCSCNARPYLRKEVKVEA